MTQCSDWFRFHAARSLTPRTRLPSPLRPLARALRPLDIAVIAIYFVMVIWIGFYLKGQSNTSEEFFMAGPRDDRVDRRA